MRFLDSNIMLRYVTGDNLPQQQLAADIVAAILNGREEAFTTDVHVHETAYILASPRGYHLDHANISSRLRPLLEMPGIKIRNKRVCLEALDIFAQHDFLDYADALAVASMRHHGRQDIYSFDGDFRRISGINRMEIVPATP